MRIVSGALRGPDAAAPPRMATGGLTWGAKRMMDIAIALLLLTLLAPVLLGAIALVLVADRQPPFYIDERVGRSGWLFKCLKLRTLARDPALLERHLAAHPDEAARYRATRKLANDPRKTRLGGFLRKHSIDEIPQLLNVLLGQMSIVGPRPLAMHEWYGRGEAAKDLLLVKPGLTGLWQVSGRSSLSVEERIACDGRYARDWSLAMDLMILLKTPFVMVAGRGAT